MKFKQKSIQEICDEIDRIVAGTHNREEYKLLFLHLNSGIGEKLSYEEVDLFCNSLVKMAKTKNRIVRSLENHFWGFSINIPYYFSMSKVFRARKEEELLANMDYKNADKRIFSRLLGLVHEVLELKVDKSEGSGLRRACSLELLAELNSFYEVPDAKGLFVNSINSKNRKEQFAALQGLECYFADSDEDIEESLVEKIEAILFETTDRSVASTCLQIQIEAGLIDEFSALLELDNWKERVFEEDMDDFEDE